MEIILIRHSTAEDKREDVEDIKRHLTKKGKKKFRKMMPEFREKLEELGEREFILWSSPANRALETAEIAAEELNMEISSVHDFIYEGSFEKLREEMQTVAEGAAVMVVGHEPTLSEWTKQMTGEELKIKKGQILCFSVLNQESLKAELQWMVLPKKKD